MAFLITLGFTVIYSPRALGESKKDQLVVKKGNEDMPSNDLILLSG
jgi:hypothetical protein